MPMTWTNAHNADNDHIAKTCQNYDDDGYVVADETTTVTMGPEENQINPWKWFTFSQRSVGRPRQKV